MLEPPPGKDKAYKTPEEEISSLLSLMETDQKYLTLMPCGRSDCICKYLLISLSPTCAAMQCSLVSFLQTEQFVFINIDYCKVPDRKNSSTLKLVTVRKISI